MLDRAALHHAIIRSFLDRERPPSVRELGAAFGASEAAVRAGLRALADDHGAVLHPHSAEVWIAHPFSAAPTTCVVRAGGKRWWGNCAWCSLGVARLAGPDADLVTTLGALGEPVTVRVRGGALVDTDYVVHFPVPMARAWDNVVYTCSVMLLFHSATEVDTWCAERGIARGDVRPIEQVWRLACEWYGTHADPSWRKWSVAEAIAIFARHGLDGPIWNLSSRRERF